MMILIYFIKINNQDIENKYNRYSEKENNVY